MTKKQLLPLLALLLASPKIMSQTVHFPEDFKLGASYFPGFKLAPMNETLRQDTGLEANPATITEGTVKKSLVANTFPSTANVERVYVEIYQGIKSSDDDAGIIAYEFASRNDLEDMLTWASKQENNQFLTKDNIAIMNWCDGSDDECKKIFAATARHYKEKLNATLWPAAHFTKKMPADAPAAEEAINAAVATATAAAAGIDGNSWAEDDPNSFPATVGAGFIYSKNITVAQGAMLRKKIDEIKKRTGVDVIIDEFSGERPEDLGMTSIALPAGSERYITVLVEANSGNFRMDMDERTARKFPADAPSPLSHGQDDPKPESAYRQYTTFLDYILKTLVPKK